ncbi:MAG TPA: peptidoglycan DD-metalloendopeptidase family protein [Gaiellaceae bacterium]|nr:peptidoglycan DD-metalloendopeptidase family protein [Gaiellaceae bacterium]
MLVLKTLTCRIALPLVMLLVCAPAAHAWSWPVQGPVLQPFAYDESHPYAAGQHRGIDIGADGAGERVVAPAGGTVSFAGSVPTNGECVTIQTPDGYTVTLTHLGTLLVAKGTSVTEGEAVATIGPGGTPELDRPYVHLGIRTTADSNGYLDPLGLLPPPAPQSAPAQSAPAQGEPAATQEPGTSGTSASIPAQPTPGAAESSPPSVATTRGSTVTPRTSRVSRHEQTRVQNPHPDNRLQRPSRRPATRHETPSNRIRLQQREAPVQTSTAQRPVVEATAPSRPAGLDAGRENRPRTPVARPRGIPHSVASPLPLALNGAAALVALAAALAARRRKRRRAAAQILHLPRPRSLQRAA